MSCSEGVAEKLCIRNNRVLNIFTKLSSNNTTRDETRATLFFVHGSMANYRQFEDLIENLEEEYDIVAWDAYGCGDSDKPRGWEEYSADEHLEDVKAIVKKYKTLRNHFICHSFGTSQGIRLASIAQQENFNISSLTLLGTALTIPDGGPALFKLPVFLLDWIQPWLTAKFAGIAFHDDCPEEIIEKSSKQSNSNPMHVCQAFYRQFKWCNLDEVANVTCPVLILQGGGDKLTPVAGAELLHSNLRDSKFHVVDKAGHQVMQEAPADVLELVRPFLAAS